MSWENINFLYLLILIPVIGLGILYRQRKRILKYRRLIKADNVINLSTRKVILKRILFILALVFLLFSAAGPRWGNRWEKIKKPGVDVILLIDTSVSMNARDIEPTRLSAARDKIKFMVYDLKAVRMGLVFFAGTAFMQCPVTFDMDAVKIFLKEAWDNLIPLPGSNIEKALKLAADSFPASETLSKKYIVLITDGEELQGNYRNALKTLKKKNIKVITYGVGTAKGGPIPIQGNGNLKGYKKGPDGNTVVTSLNKDLLEEIAGETGGEFIKYSETTSDITELNRVLKTKADEKTEEDVMKSSEIRYQYPLLVAFLLLLIEFIVSERGELR